MIGCTDKVAFTTYAGARKTAARMRRKKDEVVEEYKCRWCGKYHIGHPTTESLLKKVRRPEDLERLEDLQAREWWGSEGEHDNG